MDCIEVMNCVCVGDSTGRVIVYLVLIAVITTLIIGVRDYVKDQRRMGELFKDFDNIEEGINNIKTEKGDE